MDLLEALKQNGFNNSNIPEIPDSSEREETTVNRTIETFGEADFENTTGLPARMMNMTMFELVKRYGGEMQLKGWADILNKLMAAMEKDQKSQERRNELVEKDFIISNVIKYVDFFMNALFDLAEGQTEEIISLVLSDEKSARKKIPEIRRNSYTKISKETKKGIKDSLKRLSNKYDSKE